VSKHDSTCEAATNQLIGVQLDATVKDAAIHAINDSLPIVWANDVTDNITDVLDRNDNSRLIGSVHTMNVEKFVKSNEVSLTLGNHANNTRQSINDVGVSTGEMGVAILGVSHSEVIETTRRTSVERSVGKTKHSKVCLTECYRIAQTRNTSKTLL